MITATVYRNTRDNKFYVLNDMIRMGDKICMVPMDKRTDDKFVSPAPSSVGTASATKFPTLLRSRLLPE